MKGIKIFLLMILGLIICSMNVLAVTFVEQQNGNLANTAGITSFAENRNIGTRFVANASYDICGMRAMTNPASDTRYRLSLWSANATGWPDSELFVFHESWGLVNGSGYMIYQNASSCYTLTNGVKYWLVFDWNAGASGGYGAGVTTGGTGFADSAVGSYTGWRLYGDTYGMQFWTYSLEAPSITLSVNWTTQYPLTGTTIYNQTMFYGFNVSGLPVGTTANCSLYWNNTLQYTQNNLALNTIQYFTITKAPQFNASIQSYIECKGNNSINANSTTKTNQFDIQWGKWNYTNVGIQTTYDGLMNGYPNEVFNVTIYAQCNNLGNNCSSASPSIYLDPELIQQETMYYKIKRWWEFI